MDDANREEIIEQVTLACREIIRMATGLNPDLLQVFTKGDTVERIEFLCENGHWWKFSWDQETLISTHTAIDPPEWSAPTGAVS